MQFDIVVLTETCLSKTDCYNIDGFRRFQKLLATNKCDGIIIHLKDICPVEMLACEIMSVNGMHIKIPVNEHPFFLTSIHRSPSLD